MCLNPNLLKRNEDLYSRLYNCKFGQALQYLKGENEETVEIVKTLARVFGNSGYIVGDIGSIVDVVITYLGIKEE